MKPLVISGKQWALIQMLEITPTSRFKKDIKKFKHRLRIMQDLNEVLTLLVSRNTLPEKLLDHPLGGNWNESRECHVNPDVLLIYRVDEGSKTLFLERFGSHSELF
jgi:mRNA interferase YafQ